MTLYHQFVVKRTYNLWSTNRHIFIPGTNFMPRGTSTVQVRVVPVANSSKREVVNKAANMGNSSTATDRYKRDRHNDERPVFEDPRQNRDRRVAHLPELIPEAGCRRKAERRSDRINLGCWWMKRQYGHGGTIR